MAFGIAVHNANSGKLQFDENTPLLSLIAKGTSAASLDIPYSTSGGGSGVVGSPTTRYINLTFNNCVAPILAIRTSKPSQGDRGFEISFISRSGNTWTFTVLIWSQFGATVGWPFDWYLYDVPYNTVLPDFGLVIRDAQGRITLNSNHPPARPTNTYTGISVVGINIGKLVINESPYWDTTQQVERIDWEIYMNPFCTYAGAPSVSGFVAGGNALQTPPDPWQEQSVSGGNMNGLLLNVTNH